MFYEEISWSIHVAYIPDDRDVVTWLSLSHVTYTLIYFLRQIAFSFIKQSSFPGSISCRANRCQPPLFTDKWKQVLLSVGGTGPQLALEPKIILCLFGPF